MLPRNDFRRLRMALMREGVPDRAPVIELFVDPAVQSAFLGKPIESPADEAAFWQAAGYDYAPVFVGLLRVAEVLSGDATLTKRSSYSVYTDDDVEMSWAAEGRGVITTWKQFERFDWPDGDDLDLTPITAMRRALPESMGLIVVIGKIFTPTWMLMGFGGFADASVEHPDLIAAVFRRIGEIQFRCFERAMQIDGVTGMWMSDDVAYTEGLLVRPEIYREHLWPWYRRMGEACRERDMPFIYHSDGDLTEVLGDIIGCGFNALHPVEPKAMDIRALKQRVGDRLCLLGNVELDRLARGTPDEIRELVRANLQDLAHDGGYCVGSSNSVTNYVRLANYRAMLEEAGALDGGAP
jgi:uroporphyrinogen decarboxylase